METSEQKSKKQRWIKWALIAFALFFVFSLIGAKREVRVSETQLNTQLSENLNRPGNNPLTSASIDLQEGVGVLSLSWEQGQTLRADIIVGGDGSVLVAQNVEFSGAGFLDEAFEGVANVVLNQVLTTMSLSQRNLRKIEIIEDALIGSYSLR